MKVKTISISFSILICLLMTQGIVLSQENLKEEQEFLKEQTRIRSFGQSLAQGSTNDLNKYKDFANDILGKWKNKNKEYYALLTLEICKPLSSVRFNSNQPFTVARNYALSALADVNDISIETELELTGHVITDMYTPNRPKDAAFAQIRKIDTEIRLHAWRRMIDALDPNRDSNDIPLLNVSPPLATNLPAGISPEAIKDSKLRAEYEAAIEKNHQKAENYRLQERLRTWHRRFPKMAERYIIQAYSLPPFDVQELKQYLNRYLKDEQTKLKILDEVIKNMKDEAKKGKI